MQNQVYVICIYVCKYGTYAPNAPAGYFFLQKTQLFRLDPSLFWNYSIKQALLKLFPSLTLYLSAEVWENSCENASFSRNK